MTDPGELPDWDDSSDRDPRSSRRSELDAGWGCAEQGHFKKLMPDSTPRFSWWRPSVLWRSRNDVLARLLGDPTDGIRRRWVADQLAREADPDFMIRRAEPGPYSFMVLGDPGEGDSSQYSVVPGLLARAAGTAFMVIASDVIYPIGSVNDYPAKFFRPYQAYPGPVLAVPGNHDWYDGLGGFMRVFCDARTVPEPTLDGLRSRLRRWLWRRTEAADEEAFATGQALRAAAGQKSLQQGSYWVADSPSLRIVGIDTGIRGGIDSGQAEWLRRVSAGPKPKILITGKPLYKDNRHVPGPVEGGGFIDDIVRDPEYTYIAAIGGDVHNYQRYPVRVGDDRVIQYIVAGGGGAFMHATHTIPQVDVGGVTEDQYRCYPLRGDSLAFYSRLYGRRFRMRRMIELSQREAAAVVARRLDMTPGRPLDGPVGVSLRARIVATLLGVPRRPHSRNRIRLPVRYAYQRVFSELSDSDDPPLFKSFLRVDVRDGGVRIRCFAATGCREHETDPPVEDDFVIPFPPGTRP